MEPGTKAKIEKVLGYTLGAIVALLVVGWAIFKIWNFAALF